MHEQRVCHRDIKPSNILITKEKRVYVADFNVAKHVPVSGPDYTQIYLGKRPSLLDGKFNNEVITSTLASIREARTTKKDKDDDSNSSSEDM